MKKDRKKHPTVTEPTSASAALVLQLLSKEKELSKEAENKESVEESAKVRCKICFKEVFPKRQCAGHGSGADDSPSHEQTSEEGDDQDASYSLTLPGKVLEPSDELIPVLDSELFDLEPDFDPEIIEDLIAQGLLLINNDRASRTMTFKLLCEPSELTQEQTEQLNLFLQAILKQFHEFKREYNLSNDCVQLREDEKGNILFLRITLPTLELYDAFIQQLANNLVPLSNMKAQAPNPFSMEPKPANKSSKQEEIERIQAVEPKNSEHVEEEQISFNPTPFNMNPR